jgi:hypothetical protein
LELPVHFPQPLALPLARFAIVSAGNHGGSRTDSLTLIDRRSKIIESDLSGPDPGLRPCEQLHLFIPNPLKSNSLDFRFSPCSTCPASDLGPECSQP